MTSSESTPEARAMKRTQEYNGLLWHVATFLIINIFLWAIDLIGGGGLTWAYWITLFWGIGLLFHIAWYFIDVARSGARYEKFLEDERRIQGT